MAGRLQGAAAKAGDDNGPGILGQLARTCERASVVEVAADRIIVLLSSTIEPSCARPPRRWQVAGGGANDSGSRSSWVNTTTWRSAATRDRTWASPSTWRAAPERDGYPACQGQGHPRRLRCLTEAGEGGHRAWCHPSLAARRYCPSRRSTVASRWQAMRSSRPQTKFAGPVDQVPRLGGREARYAIGCEHVLHLSCVARILCTGGQ